ncbi:MAG: ExeA family protein [Burkholderiales bacterium]
MYYSHFGLTQPPFRITPNVEFFFGGGNRGAILEALIYAIGNGEGIIKVTGEVGSGKTMLCNMLATRLPAHIETVYLANPSVSPEEILHAIAFELQLGLDRNATRLEAMRLLQDHLLKRHAEGRRVVVFIEESQSMPLATLEEIRLLSNLETRSDKLLQIVLFGQPELDDNLRLPHIRQLRERITHSFRLDPLNPGEIREYLMFRMRAAGYRGPDLFPPAVVKRMARASHGLTRRVNLIADKALLAAFSENTHTIRPRHVAAAVRDSEFGQPRKPYSPPRYGRAAALMLAGASLGIAFYALTWNSRNIPATAGTLPAAPAPQTGAAGAPHGASFQPPSVEAAAAGEKAAAVEADVVQQRLAATREWLAGQAQSTVSIQLMGTNDEDQLRNHLNVMSKFIEINDIYVYRTVAKRKPSMTVLYGSFKDRREAEEALAKLPPFLKENRPILRTVQGIREEIRQQQSS